MNTEDDSVKEIPADKFRTRCIAVIKQVQKNGEPVLLTRHGKPLAKLVPVDDEIFGSRSHKVRIVRDIVHTTTRHKTGRTNDRARLLMRRAISLQTPLRSLHLPKPAAFLLQQVILDPAHAFGGRKNVLPIRAAFPE
jgi:prevent-host-death family protein